MRLSRIRDWRWFDWAIAAFFAALVLSSAVAVYWVGRHAVAIRRLTGGVGDTTFYSADGRPWFRMDEGRQDVALAQIARPIRDAVVAVEDHRFYKHPGLDPIGIVRAAFENVRTDNVQGASTITQQLARTLFLSNERTWARKGKEAVIAVLLETQLSKDQILELYLNRVYLSSGVYGVEPLSRRLFGKRSRDVSLDEAAMIAGLIRAPSALSPWSNYAGALDRSHVVLQRMREEGYITADAEARARTLRPRIRRYELAIDARGGYAKEYLRQQFRNEFGGNHPPDWQVHTTIDRELQAAAEAAVASLARRSPRRDVQAALVALDPHTGNLLALVGGRDFRQTSFNRAVKSRRQPGSAFKPFVYAAALERGRSPVSVLTQLNHVSATDGDEEWTPRNVGAGAGDRTTLRQALIDSDNRAAVALQQQIGSRAVLRLARDLEMRNLPDVPSLALGAGLVTPLELTRAYAVFPNGGEEVRSRAIVRVLDAEGGVAYDNVVRRERVLSPEVAFQVTSMLRDVVDRGTAQGLRDWGFRYPIAGKTGTTNDFKDAWFVGFTSNLVVGVWVGLDQPATIAAHATGARLAVPIWAEFVRRAGRRVQHGPFVVPRGLARVDLCRVSYLQAVNGCPTYTEYFKKDDDRPNRLCHAHQGTIGQRAERIVEGLIDVLASKIKGLFRR